MPRSRWRTDWCCARLPPRSGCTARTLSGFKWAILNATVQALLSLVIVIVLARLLTPQHYGQLAVAMVFITLADTLGRRGLGPAIIQRFELTEDTEFAYRVQVRGGLLVPVRAAFGWHQGRWSEGREHKEREMRRQADKLADLIPERGFRASSPDSHFSVPRYVVTLVAGQEPIERIVQIAEALLTDPGGISCYASTSTPRAMPTGSACGTGTATTRGCRWLSRLRRSTRSRPRRCTSSCRPAPPSAPIPRPVWTPPSAMRPRRAQVFTTPARERRSTGLSVASERAEDIQA